MAKPLEIYDFSGGRTDNYVEGPANCFKTGNNLVIVRHGDTGKPMTRFGSELYDSTYAKVPSLTERIGTIINFRTTSGDKLLVHANKKFYTLSGGWNNLVGPVTSNNIFPVGTTEDNVVSYAQWNDHLFITNDAFAPVSKLYNDGSNVLKLRTAGLPVLASSPTVTRGAAGTFDYLYRFIYKYTYTVGTVTFIDRGASVEVALANAAQPSATTVAITNIPVLANGATYNWDTASIKVEIYRTIDDGTNFYFVGQVTNGTTSFNDTVSDATLQTNEPLYTEGGVVENDPVPLAKLVHITGDIAYYAHINDGGEILSNRLMQAIPGDPDSVPAAFLVDVQDSITGLSSTRGLPVLLCKSSVYRVDGQFDELGRGGMVAQKISDTATCVSAQSVVQTIEGVFWAGEDSYYFTDGYRVIKLCRDWASSYKLQTATDDQKARIQGKYDKRTRRIWWTVQSEDGTETDMCDILHLDWGIKEDTCFTTASNGTSFAPTAIEFIDGDMIRGDYRGYLFTHSDDLTTDPLINTGVTPANWDTKTVVWNLETCAFNFGTTAVRKYTTRVIVSCSNESNLSLQITSVNDDGRKVEDLKPIRFRGNVVWGDPLIIWGDAAIIWGFDGLIEELRRFPSNSLRCAYKQLIFTNADSVIFTSDSLGTVTVNSVTKVATLESVLADFPADLLGYQIYFSSDDYVQGFDLTAQTTDTVTFSDAGNLSLSAAGVEWEVRGQPKGEIFKLLSYAISFEYLSQSQQFFTSGESGSVGS